MSAAANATTSLELLPKTFGLVPATTVRALAALSNGQLDNLILACWREQRSRAENRHRQTTVLHGLTINWSHARVTWRGADAILTGTELALLRELVLAYPEALTTPDLIRAVWGPGCPHANALVFVRYVRTKLPGLVWSRAGGGWGISAKYWLGLQEQDRRDGKSYEKVTS